MANNCFIDIKIETETADQAEELRKELQATFEKARRENVGAYFGSDRYLFDGKVEHDSKEVFIAGWVKWGYSDGQFIDMFSWLRRKATIKKYLMHYEEWLCLLYGEFEFREDGQMWNNFLLEKDFPKQTESDCEDFDAYCEKVEEAFRKNPATKYIEVG